MSVEEPLVLFPEDATPYTPVGSVTVPAPDLLRALAAVVHAAAVDEDRPILASVAIEPRDVSDALRVIASDNYRIAVCDVDADLGDAGDWRAAVPAALEDVKRLVAVLKSIPDIRSDDCGARAVLTLGTKELDGSSLRRLDAFVSDETPIARLPLRVVDGLYPDVSSVFPTSPAPVGAFNAQFLADAAKAAGSADPDGVGIVRQAQGAKGADGPFVFTSGRFTEVVMPVKVTSAALAEPEPIGRRIVESMTGALERAGDPDAHDAAAEAARRLLSPVDGTEVTVTVNGQTFGARREVDPETGEILDVDNNEWVASARGQAALERYARRRKDPAVQP